MFKGKEKTASCNVVYASLREYVIDVVSLTDSEEEEIILTAEQSAPPVAGIWLGQQYLKKYNEAATSFSQPAKEVGKKFTKQPVDKHKRLKYAKALQEDKAEGSSIPFWFNVLAQLANIPARITL